MYKKIMVPLDGSQLAECVLPHLEAIAKGCGTKEIILVRAVETAVIAAGWVEYAPSQQDFRSSDKPYEAEAEAYLKNVISRMKYAGVNVRSEVIVGKSAADVLADYAAKNCVDLIIMATHGRSGMSRLLLGSVAQKLSQSACAPILMVRSPSCKV